MTKPLRFTTILVAALLAAAVSAFSVPSAKASPAALEQATSHCWLDVINDWLDNDQVDNTYAVPCYTQAIQQLSARPDIAGYSSAIDDIHRALLAVIRQDRNNGGPGNGGSNQGPNGSQTSGPGGGGPSNPGGGGRHSFFGIGGPSSATSIPLPLIVLGALAILLALAALATWFARRFQARRPAPAPALAKRR